MTEQPVQSVDVIATIKRLRQGALVGHASSEVLERVREYEKTETAANPGRAFAGAYYSHIVVR